jgi:hypothetical protein
MTILSGPRRKKIVLFSAAASDDRTPRQEEEEEEMNTSVKAAKQTPQIQHYWHDQPENTSTLSTTEEHQNEIIPDAVKRRGTKRPTTRTGKKINKYKYISLTECSQHFRELVNVYAVR